MRMEMVTIPKEEYEYMISELKKFKGGSSKEKFSEIFERVYAKNVSKEQREQTMKEVKEVRKEMHEQALREANGDPNVASEIYERMNDFP